MMVLMRKTVPQELWIVTSTMESALVHGDRMLMMTQTGRQERQLLLLLLALMLVSLHSSENLNINVTLKKRSFM